LIMLGYDVRQKSKKIEVKKQSPAVLAAGILLFAAAVFGVSAAAVAEDWPTYMHDNHRSGVTSENLQLPLPVGWVYTTNRPPRPAWLEMPALYDIWHQLTGDYRSQVAYDLAYQVAVVGESLYFGSSNADVVVCLNAANGLERWRFFTNGPVRFAPAVYEGKVYFGSDDGSAYCVNASDGSLVWSYKAAVSNRLLFGNSRMVSTSPVRTSVLVENGAAYWAAGFFSQLGHYLCARNADTGAQVWSRTPAGPSQGYLLSANGILFVPSGRFSPVTYSLLNGSGGGAIGIGGCYALIIDTDFANGPGYGGSRSYINDSGAAIARVDGNCLVVNGGYSYFCTDDELVKLKRDTGAVQWSVPSPYRYSLIIATDTIFAGGDDEVAAFSTATGQKLWTAAVNGRACGLAAANSRLYVSTDLGAIHTFGSRYSADLDNNGSVDLADLLIFTEQWLHCTDPNDARCSPAGP
jgi:outer membrane protein assembly factor BamB